MAKISWQHIAKHITGISISAAGFGVGVTWKPTTPEEDEAKRLLFYLEDRRVLYNDFMIESDLGAKSSVKEMREDLGHMLQEKKIDPDSHLAKIAREMQAACRAFVDVAERQRPRSRAYPGEAPRPNAR